MSRFPEGAFHIGRRESVWGRLGDDGFVYSVGNQGDIVLMQSDLVEKRYTGEETSYYYKRIGVIFTNIHGVDGGRHGLGPGSQHRWLAGRWS